MMKFAFTLVIVLILFRAGPSVGMEGADKGRTPSKAMLSPAHTLPCYLLISL